MKKINFSEILTHPLCANIKCQVPRFYTLVCDAQWIDKFHLSCRENHPSARTTPGGKCSIKHTGASFQTQHYPKLQVTES